MADPKPLIHARSAGMNNYGIDDFARHTQSPFDDGYDLEAERALLKHLLDADDPDMNDPLFPRLLLLWDREEAIKQQAAIERRRQRAEKKTPSAVATARIGGLKQKASLQLHTRQAHRLWMGRLADPGKRNSVVGVMRWANALYQAWDLTKEDNPYADWVLIQAEQRMDDLDQALRQRSHALEELFAEWAERGLSTSIMVSRTPLLIEDLRFGSPYGFRACALLLRIDYLIRALHTAESTARITKEDLARDIREIVRQARRAAQDTVVQTNFLTTSAVAQLTREHLKQRHLLPPDLLQRIDDVLGKLDPDVLAGNRRPAHFRPVRSESRQAKSGAEAASDDTNAAASDLDNSPAADIGFEDDGPDDGDDMDTAAEGVSGSAETQSRE